VNNRRDQCAAFGVPKVGHTAVLSRPDGPDTRIAPPLNMAVINKNLGIVIAS
jgi:hypothetical protein